MAETENRGGMRPTAPQNNPANVNGLGGNGQSGNIDYTGFGYGMNKAVNEQRQAAPIKSDTARVVPVEAQQLPPVVPLDAPTQRPTKSNVVASATRSVAPKKITLTPSEVSIAKRLGVPLEQYAREAARLRREKNG